MSEIGAGAAEGLAIKGVLSEKGAFEDATREIAGNQATFKDQLGLQDTRIHELTARETAATSRWDEVNPHPPEQARAVSDLVTRVTAITQEILSLDNARNNEFAPLMEAAKTKDRKVRVQLPIALSICELTRRDLSEFLPRRSGLIDSYQAAVEALESSVTPKEQS